MKINEDGVPNCSLGKCGDCWGYKNGQFKKNIRRGRDKKWSEIRECAIHPNCFISQHGISCEQFTE